MICQMPSHLRALAVHKLSEKNEVKAADYMPISSWLAATNLGYVNEDNGIPCELKKTKYYSN